jgi:hypothetical protein
MAHNRNHPAREIQMAGIKCTQLTVANWDGLTREYNRLFRTDYALKTKKKWIFRADKRKKVNPDDENKGCQHCQCDKNGSPCKEKDNNVFFRTGLEKAFVTFNIYDFADREEWEIDLLREFKRKGHHYIANSPKKADIIEWLALMRHYGAPTRLLDFTYTFFVACYFAINQMDCESEIAEIWAIDTQWLWPLSEQRIKHILGAEYEITKTKAQRLSEKQHGYSDSVMDNEIIHFLMKATKTCVYNVTPFRLNERLINQLGTFLLQGDITKCFLYNLKETLQSHQCGDTQGTSDIIDATDHIMRVVLQFSDLDAKKLALRELDQMRINQAVLFPDLQGFAESLERRLAFPEKRYRPWPIV